jgi:hypothetical protein
MPLDEAQLVALVRKSLNYDSATGIFTWVAADCNRVKSGGIAGSVGEHGYRRIMVGGARYPAHRLAWLYVYGRWPHGQIDHVNRVRDDNRIANLRECTPAENGQNRTIARNNTSGFTGACFNKLERKWIAYIRANGRRTHLGYFRSAQEAHAAHREAKRQLHTFNPAEAA